MADWTVTVDRILSDISNLQGGQIHERRRAILLTWIETILTQEKKKLDAAFHQVDELKECNVREMARNDERVAALTVRNVELLSLVRKIDAFFENPKIIVGARSAVLLDIPYEIAAGVKGALEGAVKPESNSYIMHQIQCPFLTGGLCSCQYTAFVEKPTCTHKTMKTVRQCANCGQYQPFQAP